MSKVYVLSGSWGCYECDGESELLFVAKSRASAEAKLEQIKAHDEKQSSATIAFRDLDPWAKARSENPPPPTPWSGSISIDEPAYKAWREEHGTPWEHLCQARVIELAKEIAVAHGAEVKYGNGVPYFGPTAASYKIEEVECEE